MGTNHSGLDPFDRWRLYWPLIKKWGLLRGMHKKMKKIVRKIGASLPLLLLLDTHVRAEDWQNLVQPSGTVLTVESAATVNARLGGFPPFALSTDVTTIQTRTPLYFVRFYNPNSPVNPSNAIGSWVMRSAAVRGMTPTEVRDIFALPAQPSMMTLVQVPANSRMYTGIAGPIAGWGDGGAQQSKLIGPPWVPAENFMNQQAIGACVLCYRTMATEGNANRTAAYLDRRIPTAYSDLENVYTNLDLLYFQPTATTFRLALKQISPERYDNLAIDALRASVLFNDASDQRVLSRLLSARRDGVTPGENTSQGRSAWIRITGSKQRAGDLGFNTRASAIFAGTDGELASGTLLGFAAGFVRSDLNWNDGMGTVNTGYAKAGTYAAWLPGNWLLQIGLNAGFSEGNAQRRLAFAMVDRTATASTDGWEGNGSVRIGYRLPVEHIDLIPTASLDYVYQRRNGFTEKGADSLNLRVQSVSNRTLRSQVGFVASFQTQLDNAKVLTPQLQLGWAQVRPLDDRTITASLEGQAGSFSVSGNTKTTNSLIANAGLNLISGQNFSLSVRYGIEYRRDLKAQELFAGMTYGF